MTSRITLRTTLGLTLLASALSACAPLLVGGAVGSTVLVATDRRTSGTQLEDQGIELRAANRLRDQMGTRARISVTSFNRRVLLTGEVANARDKALAEQIVSEVDNVQGLVNELGITASPSLGQQANDTLTTGKVKAALVDTKDLSANAFKVVSERGSTYLMGRVTQREADRATEVTRSVSGVQRVVRVLEIISDEELRRIQAGTSPQAPVEDRTAK
ncbi:BON domain-containing protein [Hydrogenophaga sp. OTU3427]|uniref:BON domain-containing protein n=1 Tax=Hydrogenophaga sp. OTU3427 TaxID=3043856 RepID=UPI00313BF527